MIRGVIRVTPNHLHAPTLSNTPAIVVLQGRPGERRFIAQVEWSYSSAPTGTPTVTIEDGIGNVVKQFNIVNAGPDHIPFIPPIAGTKGASWRVTLSAGGNGRLGKVMVSEFIPHDDQG